ncbi:MAG: aldo/keto reductase [Gammaproteobacteria bacterium]|nr:MAG: aldo/keto reductase [Gammaproteobacteria bacterium]
MDWTRQDLDRRTLLKLMAAAAGAAILRSLPADDLSDTIRSRLIPSSGEALPVIGLGTAHVFDVGQTVEEREPLSEVLGLLTQGGGSVIDTSPMYGRAERVVGDLVSSAGLADRVFIATKVWITGRTAGIEQMQESMRLLKVDRIDLMQVHNLVDWRTHIETLRAWKEEGRIRYVGITHYRTDAHDELEAVMRAVPLDFVQLNYSMLTPDAESRLLPLAQEKGIAILVNRPYERGAVFSRVRGRELPGWAPELGIGSWGQFFLKWVLSHPAVTCVIPGTSKPHHMLDNIGAGFGVLPDAEARGAMREYVLGNS